jgi:hypothetical protein
MSSEPSQLFSDFSIIVRKMLLQEAQAGNNNTLHATIRSSFFATSYSYTHSSIPITDFESSIHDLWYGFIQSASHIEPNHPAQDRLVGLVLHARELGVLKRARDENIDGKTIKIEEEAVTSGGRIWVDLPFLVDDLKKAWEEAMEPSFPHWKRENLAAFIAKLAGLGLCDNRLAGCGLSVMNKVLEIQRDLVPKTPASPSTLVEASDDDVDGTSDINMPETLTVLDLISVVKLWLVYAGNKMSQLSNADFDSITWSAEPGHLAIADGIIGPGFSKPRFTFWRKRLENLKWCDEESVWERASHCVELMKSISLERRV